VSFLRSVTTSLDQACTIQPYHHRSRPHQNAVLIYTSDPSIRPSKLFVSFSRPLPVAGRGGNIEWCMNVRCLIKPQDVSFAPMFPVIAYSPINKPCRLLFIGYGRCFAYPFAVMRAIGLHRVTCFVVVSWNWVLMGACLPVYLRYLLSKSCG